MELLKSELPGVGMKYQLETKAGSNFIIVHHEDGRREIYCSDPEDQESLIFIAELEDEECMLLSSIIGGWNER
ncbi:hypothetical protein ACFSVM_07625 [Paenibacillus shunpengii]|uniref:Potassium/proton antiporter subunit KhtT-like N-terminal domain-containing protein n=1 Tax=Paenibacillus shunpengii TaxID=2054424 RepID=A0ABW5SKR3_9BACL|nr:MULTISPECIES: hypothetical protein [unclassified Paenibacillus]OMC70813.1 hypothetical protein BK126_01460 [Paenibacillus sp. FSL H7-0326]SDW09136.1 TrkA domain protein [Paenibacillus sp. PDC88]